MSDGVLPLAGALLSLAGSLFFLTAAVGLLRLPDFYTRAHAPTKAATLGLLLCAHRGRSSCTELNPTPSGSRNCSSCSSWSSPRR